MSPGVAVLTIRHVAEGAARPVEPADLTRFRAAPSTGYLWIDVTEPDPAEDGLLDDLGLHPMVVEDMREDRHMPKLEVYPDELALTVHGLRIDRVAEEVDTVELDISLRRQMLVTYHVEDAASVRAVRDRMDAVGVDGLERPVQLLHRILDTMNDVMVPFVEHLERWLDVVEEDLLSTPTETTRQDLYRLQRDVIQLRRVVVPQAEVLRRLGREATGLVDEADRGLFRDVHDHLYRMAELSDSYRQLLDSAVNSYRSAQDDELNDMLRVLTLVSATLLPLSVVAGIYGTNFVYIPELDERPAYFVMLGAFVAIVVGMVAWFRHRGWIGRAAEREAQRRRSTMRTVLHVPVLGSVLRVPVRGVRAVARRGRDVIRNG